MTKVKLVDACRSLLGELSADRDYARELHAQAKKLLTRLKKLEDKYSAAQSPVPAAPVYAPDERLPAPAATAAPVRTSAEMPHEPAAPAPVYRQPSPPAPLPAAERPAQETMEKTCSWCRFMFDFPSQLATFPCPACGAVNGRPQAKGMSYDCLKRATHQRLGCDFHNAEISYQHVLLEYPEEHEALWGLALCRYGIEYVDDPRTGRRMPTVHGVRRRPMQLDNDYLAAVGNAPQGVRERYEAEALYVDDAMARIRKLAETQPGFDVFICHKTTRPDSDDPTWECLRASEVAHQLERQGYRVFFAPECMRGVAAGSDYEAAIFHALETSKVMLLFCSEPDYVTSPWVRSEWTRFLDMTDEREDKRLVPLLYGDFTAGKLPREIRARRLEGIPMDSWTAKDDVLRVLEKYCGLRGVQGAAPVRDEPVQEKHAPKKAAPAKPVQEKPVEEKKPAPKKAAPAKTAPIYTPESDFETAPVEGGCSITRYTGWRDEVKVPPMIDGLAVVEVGEHAFAQCGGLTSVTLPEGLKIIGTGAFAICDKMTSITLPESLTMIGRSAFSHCGNLMNLTLPKGLTDIGNAAFSGCTGLKSITLPEGLRRIDEEAFFGCESLMRLTLPDSLTTIGIGAFNFCLSLTNVSLPEQASVHEMAFVGCDSLESENIIRRPKAGAVKAAPSKPAEAKKPAPAEPASIYTPESDFFTLPVVDGCRILGYRGQSGDVKIPPTIGGLQVVEISDFSFKKCSRLTSITLPEGVVSIGCEAFSGCSCLTSIVLPEGLTSIGYWAFRKCSNLTSITLPKSIREMDYSPFEDCEKLQEIAVSPSHERLSVVDGVLFSKDGKTLHRYPCSLAASHYEVPFGVTAINGGAFQHCNNLMSVTLPEGLMSIGDEAFKNCKSLKSIIIPESLSRIGKQAFSGCDSLPHSLKLKLKLKRLM